MIAMRPEGLKPPHHGFVITDFHPWPNSRKPLPFKGIVTYSSSNARAAT
jgi:hypothetical protein